MHNRKLVLIAVSVAGLIAGAAVAADPRLPDALKLEQKKPASNKWLRDADSDAERFRRIEINERGFAQAMAEVGIRFGEVHDAISAESYELALYQWEKIADSINVGLMRRPGRTQNAEAIFLDGVWKELHAALAARDRVRILEQFGNARQACMACHVAEGMPYLNDSRMFRDTIVAPR